MKFENCTVEFDRHRWYVRVTVTPESGEAQVFYASADSGYTAGSGIWFGTSQEYEAAGEAL